MARAKKIAALLDPAARLALGLTFVAAALLKLRDPAAFADAVARYHIVSGQWPSLLAVFLPALELLAGTAVLLRRTHLGALFLLGGASVTFTGALGSAWWRGLDLACGCFGPGRTAHGDIPFAFVRALALAVVAFALLWHERRHARPTP